LRWGLCVSIGRKDLFILSFQPNSVATAVAKARFISYFGTLLTPVLLVTVYGCCMKYIGYIALNEVEKKGDYDRSFKNNSSVQQCME
jgi:hypothetical protein